MSSPGPGSARPGGLGAALRLRALVLRRRHVSPLEVLLLAGLSWLAWVVGREAAARGSDEALALGAALALAATLAAGAAGAARLLHASPELVLLLGHGLSPRGLVRLRAVELVALLLGALLPLLAALAGVAHARGERPSLLLAAAWPVLAVALAAASLLLAPRARGAVLLAAVVLVAGVDALRAALGPGAWPGEGVLTPGSWLLALARGAPGAGAAPAGPAGQTLAGLAALALAGAAGLAAADRLLPERHGAGVDRAARRDPSSHPVLWRATAWLDLPLGRAASALARADAAVLLRGGFPRGVALLALAPLLVVPLHLALHEVALARAAKPWHVELLALFGAGALASAAGFLFGVDLPLARRAGDRSATQGLLRPQPLRGARVHRARWALGAAVAAGLAAATALAVALLPAPHAAPAGAVLVKGALLGLAITHHAAAYGLVCEVQGGAATATAYPLAAGTLVVVLGTLLLLHPLGVLAYPLLGYLGFAARAGRAWEAPWEAP